MGHPCTNNSCTTCTTTSQPQNLFLSEAKFRTEERHPGIRSMNWRSSKTKKYRFSYIIILDEIHFTKNRGMDCIYVIRELFTIDKDKKDPDP